MESQIKIHFSKTEEGIEPIISIKAVDSDDPRDSLLIAFFEQLGSKSSWCQVSFDHYIVRPDQNFTSFITLRPLKSSELNSLKDYISDIVDGSVQSEGPLNCSPFAYSPDPIPVNKKDDGLRKAFEEKCAKRRKR